MKFNKGFGKRFGRGSLSVSLSALVIAAVILLNVGVSALFGYQMWHIDNTSHELFTLTETAVNYLKYNLDEVKAGRTEEDPLRVDILFCSDPDVLCQNERMKLVYYTALELEKAFRGTVYVSTCNVREDSSAVLDYMTTTYSTIYEDNIIVSSGSEFRVFSLRDMYVYDTAMTLEPWAYDAEKVLTRGIVAVTRAQSPLCGILTNHGESLATPEGRAEYSTLLSLLEQAGYDVIYLNLETDEIPKDCRLLLCMDPQTDFKSSQDGVSEIRKLDDYLAESNSLMMFADADTPRLANLEEFLEEWGISYGRYDEEGVSANLQAVDPFNAMDPTGTRIIGNYETEALGGTILSNLINYGKPKIVFDNVLPISYSRTYVKSYMIANGDTGTGAYTFASYNRNGVNRCSYEVLFSGTDSYAYAKKDGAWLRDGAGEALIANNDGGYQLMTMTVHNRSVGEGQGYTNVNDASYVCAVGSTEMAKDTYLASRAYGNADALLAIFRTVGHEVVPSGVKLKILPSTDAGSEYCTPFAITAWTVVLVLIPTAVAVLSGCAVLIRRRFAH